MANAWVRMPPPRLRRAARHARLRSGETVNADRGGRGRVRVRSERCPTSSPDRGGRRRRPRGDRAAARALHARAPSCAAAAACCARGSRARTWCSRSAGRSCSRPTASSRHPSEGALPPLAVHDRPAQDLAPRRVLARRAPRRRPRGGGRRGAGGEEDSLLGAYRGFVSPSRALAVKEEVERVEGAFDQLEERDRELIVEAHLRHPAGRASPADGQDRGRGARPAAPRPRAPVRAARRGRGLRAREEIPPRRRHGPLARRLRCRSSE